MFINKEDYKVVIGDAAFKVISQADPDTVANAEFEAVEEMSGYLRPVYDTEAIFSATGNVRNRLVVMYTADIALYHLSAALPQKMGAEIRKERYDRAIKWLEGVQSGRIVPDLPLAEDTDGNGATIGISFHSAPKLNHDW
nr:phage protein Gp36 family protein [uncultured Duncaniella sp.]